jgi:hypothetical protein
MINSFSDPIFQVLLNSGYRIVTIYPHPEVQAHYIFDDLRNDSDETVLAAVAITEFLGNHRGLVDPATILGLLATWLERNKTVSLRLHKIPYITHASI